MILVQLFIILFNHNTPAPKPMNSPNDLNIKLPAIPLSHQKLEAKN